MTFKPLRTLPLASLLTLLSISAWGDVATAKYEYEKGHFAVALEKTQPLAEAGDSDAQILMGVMYTDGKAVPRDYAQAANWYVKAALAGNAKAQETLSAIYADGRGVPPDADLANYWKWQAAVARENAAKNNLDAEVAKQPQRSSVDPKYVAPVINLNACKVPAYRRTGYGYHLSGEMHLLFLVDAKGKALEASLAAKSDWPLLDSQFLDSFSKTCTFKPATRDGIPIPALYMLTTSWSVDP